MNWKVRLKNPVFLISFVSAVIAVIYSILGLMGIIPTVSENTLVEAVTVIISALTTIGVLVDPTTKGIKDSERAMTYTEPMEDEEKAEG